MHAADVMTLLSEIDHGGSVAIATHINRVSDELCSLSLDESSLAALLQRNKAPSTVDIIFVEDHDSQVKRSGFVKELDDSGFAGEASTFC